MSRSPSTTSSPSSALLSSMLLLPSRWSDRPWRMCLVGVSVLLMLQFLPQGTLADYEHTCYHSDYYRQQRGVCGRNLVERVRELCTLLQSSSSNNNGRIKRSFTNSQPAKSLEDIMLSKKSALTYLAAKRSGNQNIVCECCVNSCNPYELMQYCQLPDRVRRDSPADLLNKQPSMMIE